METTEGLGLLAAAGATFGVIMLLFTVYSIITGWIIFTKAGQPGWACLIPFYNIYIFTKIIGKPGIWVLWLLLPFINIIFGIWATNLLSKSFGKGVGFTILLILLNPIAVGILAFGSAKYVGPAGANA